MEIKIQEAMYLTSTVDQDCWIQDETKEICFIGKSNVGKSSLINMLLNRKNLARTAAAPGKTRMLNFFKVKVNDNEFRLVDAPGYGFAKVNFDHKAQFAKMMDQYLANRKNLKLIVLLADLRHPPSKDDVQMGEYLRHFRIPTLLIGTKIDKLKKNDIIKNKKMVMQDMAFSETTPFVACSSVDRSGYEACWTEIMNALKAD